MCPPTRGGSWLRALVLGFACEGANRNDRPHADASPNLPPQITSLILRHVCVFDCVFRSYGSILYCVGLGARRLGCAIALCELGYAIAVCELGCAIALCELGCAIALCGLGCAIAVVGSAAPLLCGLGFAIAGMGG